MVDVPPFQALDWQAATGSGPPYPGELPTADSNGNMNLNIYIGGQGTSYNVSCWAAVGQSYSIPNTQEFQDGGLVNFSASPSFTWQAFWASQGWLQAAGNIWIGQVINQFDDQGSLISTPVSYQTSLLSWNDYNLADFSQQSGESTGFNVQCSTFVQPGFFYECWVWIGASANAGSGSSFPYSTTGCQMSANVTSLIFDTSDCPPSL